MRRLAPYAGYDPRDRSWKLNPLTGTGVEISSTAKAITASKDACLRYRRWREAARFNPPREARGQFPYYGKGEK